MDHGRDTIRIVVGKRGVDSERVGGGTIVSLMERVMVVEVLEISYNVLIAGRRSC